MTNLFLHCVLLQVTWPHVGLSFYPHTYIHICLFNYLTVYLFIIHVYPFINLTVYLSINILCRATAALCPAQGQEGVRLRVAGRQGRLSAHGDDSIRKLPFFYFICPNIYLSIYPFICHSLYLSSYISIHIFSLDNCNSFHLSLYPSISIWRLSKCIIYLSIYICLRLFICQSIYLYIFISVYLSLSN